MLAETGLLNLLKGETDARVRSKLKSIRDPASREAAPDFTSRDLPLRSSSKAETGCGALTLIKARHPPAQ